MRKHDELSDPSSCLNRAHDDEWVFVLLGRDAAAPAAVQAWIDERICLGKNQRSDAQIVEAEQWIKTVTGNHDPAPQLTEATYRLLVEACEATVAQFTSSDSVQIVIEPHSDPYAVKLAREALVAARAELGEQS